MDGRIRALSVAQGVRAQHPASSFSASCASVEIFFSIITRQAIRRGPVLRVRSVPLAFAGFLTCAGFPRFAFPGSRIPDFSSFSLQIHWLLADSRHDAPEPSSRLTDVNG